MFCDDDQLRLIAAMRAHGVTTLEVEAGGDLLRVALAAGPAAAPAPAARPAAAPFPAISPDIGTFLPRGDDDGLPPLAEGDHVLAEEVLGYCRRGAIRAAIISPAAGRINGPIPETSNILGHGDPVFFVEQS